LSRAVDCEVVLKLLSRGVCFGRFTFLRDPWNWLDVSAVCFVQATVGTEPLEEHDSPQKKKPVERTQDHDHITVEDGQDDLQLGAAPVLKES
ncbi:hypothetical protein AMECASPLE_024125, partial [Ameca splendens]